MKRWIFGGLAAVIVAIVGLLLFNNHGVSQPDGKQKTANQNQPQEEQPPSHIDEVLADMSLRDKVASLFVFHSPGTDPAALGAFVKKYQPGGMILMGDNIPTSDAALQNITKTLRGPDEKLPRLVAIDEEGGIVKRLPGDTFASAQTLKNQPPSATRQAFAKRSAMLQSVSITLNFGIIADQTANQNSFIYPRVLGTTPQSAAERVAAAVNGAEGKTLSTLKHFPGHGRPAGNSHHTIPTTPISYDTWRNSDALPFKAGIDAGTELIMMGHLRYSAVDTQPASLSKKWHDILRNDLGFDGVIISDDMFMLQDSGEAAYRDPVKNAVGALAAGNTMLLYVLKNNGSDATYIDPAILINGVVAAVKSGTLDEKLVTAKAERVLKLQAKSADF